MHGIEQNYVDSSASRSSTLWSLSATPSEDFRSASLPDRATLAIDVQREDMNVPYHFHNPAVLHHPRPPQNTAAPRRIASNVITAGGLIKRLRGNPCSVPRSKKEFESFRASQQRARTVASKTENQHQHQHQHIRDVLMPIPNSSSDSDSSDSDASIPAVLPRKRKWESKGEESGSGMVEQLKGMIRTMEDEFKDVLRAEHDKHAREIQELRDKHQEELTQQREKYESRIDDLIKIMKKIG
ncbi:hypothetical protein AAE478_001077 [Parahypoxylon ruwenzoriense]